MISGATVTSKAVLGGINAIKEVYAAVAGVEVSVDEIVEPEAPAYTLNDDYSDNQATIVSEADGVYTVEAKGFTGTNTFEVEVADGAVVSVKMVNFNDTVGIGDNVNDDYFATLVGATLESDVDVVSGATYTSKSALAAVQLALNPVDDAEENEESAVLYATDDANVLSEADGVYTVEAKGFAGVNVYEITVKDGAITAVVMSEFNDTPGIGDQVNDEYLAQYVGVENATDIDVVAGATYTSKSAQAAVQAVLDYIANN